MTADVMRFSDWSSDVCSSDLPVALAVQPQPFAVVQQRLASRDLPQVERPRSWIGLGNEREGRPDTEAPGELGLARVEVRIFAEETTPSAGLRPPRCRDVATAHARPDDRERVG